VFKGNSIVREIDASLRQTPLLRYEQILQGLTYVTDDPYEPSLEVRCLQNQQYVVQVPDDQGRVRIPELDLWLGVCYGERLGQMMNWLRWWNASGDLLLWSSEQVEQER